MFIKWKLKFNVIRKLFFNLVGLVVVLLFFYVVYGIDIL